MNNNKPKYNEIVFTEKQEKQIIDMYVNQKISTVKIGKYFNCGHKIIAKVLERYGIKRTGVGKRKYILNEHYFDNIDTPNKAYILGFFYADGCNYTPKQTISMSLQEDDRDDLDRIRIEIGSEKELEFVDYSNKHNFGYTYKNQYRLLLFSAYMSKVLEEKGMMCNKSLQLKFPQWLDKNLLQHFIRGYFDGDGSMCFCTTNHNCVANIISTIDFCEAFKTIVENETGVHVTITQTPNHSKITKCACISGKNQVKTFLDWIYKDADLYLTRKYQKYIDKYY